MIVQFHPEAWSDYTNLQSRNVRISAKINELIDNVCRSPFSGLGKPEPLKGGLKGWWSRRITDEHRLVYRVAGDAASGQRVEVVQCVGHY